jgi:hypothetical protein
MNVESSCSMLCALDLCSELQLYMRITSTGRAVCMSFRVHTQSNQGILEIRGLRESHEQFDNTSARINTKGHAAFYPGMKTSDGRTWSTIHIEAHVKMPQPGTGLWGAFWLYPEV